MKAFPQIKIKSSLFSRYYTNRAASGGALLRGLAPGQQYSEETSQRWRAVGGTVSYLTDPGIEPQAYRTNSDVTYHYANQIIKSSTVAPLDREPTIFQAKLP